jgi:hypothetical protein
LAATRRATTNKSSLLDIHFDVMAGHAPAISLLEAPAIDLFRRQLADIDIVETPHIDRKHPLAIRRLALSI